MRRRRDLCFQVLSGEMASEWMAEKKRKNLRGIQRLRLVVCRQCCDFVFVDFVAKVPRGKIMSSEGFHDQKSLGTAGLEHFETPS